MPAPYAIPEMSSHTYSLEHVERFKEALDKLGWKHLYGQAPVEPVQPNIAFDIASLVLYGTQALPIRLKILLDRLFSVLQREEVLQVLHGFGWTHEDYARGYILQEPHGGVLERWNICSPEEEPLVLQQFLRFGETRAITQQLLLAQADQAAAAATLSPDKDRDREREERERQIQMHHIKVEADLKRLMEKNTLRPKVEPEERKPEERGRTRSPPHHLTSRRPSPQPPSPREKNAPLNLKNSTQNGPTTSLSSPPSITTSPLSVSPLNRLQSMQPFDFRKIPSTSESSKRRPSDASDCGPMGVNSPSWHLPPPMPLPPTTSTGPLNMSQQALSSNNLMSNFPPIGDRKSPVIKVEKTASSDFGSECSDDDDDRYSALNLSRDSSGKSSRKQGSYPRKGMSPMKRGWSSNVGLPLNLGTQLINPATGKKRVQCNVCLKTFCDKGALKIHFSAVHLREMHKCTVDGCNMMFSSRRSRNRHSANPNPKLHSPHLRRKISPHDGRSSGSHPLLMPPHGGLSLPGGLNHLSFGAFPLLTPPPELRQQAMDLKQSLDLTLEKYEERRNEMHYQSSDDGALNSGDNMDDEDDYEGIVVVGDEEEEKTSDEDVKRGTKISMSDADEADSNEDSLSVVDNQSVKEDATDGPPNPKRGRKRKNQNPTKCSLPVRIAHRDGMSTDGEDSRDGDAKMRADEGDGQKGRSDPLSQLTSLSQGRFDDRTPSSPVGRDDREKRATVSPTRSASSASIDRELLNNESNEGAFMKHRDRPMSENQHKIHTEKPFSGPFPPEFLSRLYSEQLGYPLNGTALPFSGLGFPGLPYPFLGNGLDRKDPSRTNTPPSPAESPALSDIDLPSPDRDGRLPCRFCGAPYTDASTLRDHISTSHSGELYRCSLPGCNKAYTSRAARNRHIERHDRGSFDRQENSRRGSASSIENGS